MTSTRPERIYLRIPIIVRGVENSGDSFSEITVTVKLNRNGALIVLRALPAQGSEVEITNLSTNRVSRFRIAYQGLAQADGCTDFGVAMKDPLADFWAIDFEDRPPSDKALVAGLLICSKCNRRTFGYLSPDEFRSLGEDYHFPRLCPHCQAVTEWQIGFSEEISPDSATEAAAQKMLQEEAENEHPTCPIERRGAVRYALKVPLLVTGPAGKPEKTVAENFSSTGLMFGCSRKFEPGELVQVIIGHGVAESPALRTCKIVRRVPEEDSSRYTYGVRFQMTP
jgi:PilZ domain-containing protein